MLRNYRFAAYRTFSGTDEIQDMPANYGVPTGRPIVSLSGITIANNWADLLDGAIATGDLDTAGVLSTADWWSGSDEFGVFEASFHCLNWTSNDGGEVGMQGRSYWSGTSWIACCVAPCDSMYHLLCIAW